MIPEADKVEALDWVLAKLSAKAPASPRIQPPKPVVQPKAPQAGVVPFKGVVTPQVSRDLKLWHAWNTAPAHEKGERFDDLMGAMNGVVKKAINKFRGAPVNKVTLENKAYDLAFKAFTRYDPANPKGANPSTWLSWNLRGLKREAVKLQNVARVTEPTSELANKFQTARAELTSRLGYDPTLHQIAEHSGLSQKQVLKVHRELRSDYEISEGGDEVEGAGITRMDPYVQAAHIVYHQLKPHEQKVHELMFPRDGGRAIEKSGDLARKLKWDVSKVSKAKKVIRSKILERVRE